MAEKITVAIVGPGAIGGFLAGVFMNAGSKVTLVARREAVPGIVERGLCLKTALLGDRVIWPKAVETLEEASDVICLATKVTELPAALSQIRKGVGQDTIIIPFQNGLEHVDLLQKEFGNRVAVGMIGNIVAEKNESGCIVSSSKKVTIELGSRKVPRDRLEAVGQLLQKSGIAVSIYDNEGEVIWHKLARLAPLAALTAASGKVLGEIRDDERWRGKLIACTEEAAALAQKEGVFIASADILKQLETMPATVTTSLSRDVAKGMPGEMDAIVGGICRLAEKRGTPHSAFDEMRQLIEGRIILYNKTT